MADDSQQNGLQYLRSCTLVVSGLNLSGLDLSDLRIKFSVKRSDTATPNTADIRVYNIEEQTALRIRKEFTKVLLQGGYQGNHGVIFQGNIKQVIIGRESATDTFIDIIAGDGDQAYNFAIVNQTLSKGSTQKNQVDAAVGSMAAHGVTAGHMSDTPTTQLPRGKVMFGNSRDYLRTIAQTNNSTWSIQNGKVTFVATKSYLPGTAVKISSTTGMVGTPQQTNDGVNVKVLMNPNINPSGRVQIDTSSILQQKLNFQQVAAAQGNTSTINNLTPRNLNADGSYYVLVLEHVGDTRGPEWYTNLTCLNINVSANPSNSVQVGASGG
jgi:hypothetical protein